MSYVRTNHVALLECAVFHGLSLLLLSYHQYNLRIRQEVQRHRKWRLVLIKAISAFRRELETRGSKKKRRILGVWAFCNKSEFWKGTVQARAARPATGQIQKIFPCFKYGSDFASVAILFGVGVVIVLHCLSDVCRTIKRSDTDPEIAMEAVIVNSAVRRRNTPFTCIHIARVACLYLGNT